MNEREIFTAARQLPDAAERDAFLDQVCAGDQELRRRIVTLLEEQAQLGSFLEHNNPPASTMDVPHHELPGTVIGPYKLLQQIGEGGMGVVWMAEQTQPVQRKVALKIIKAGMDTRQVIARFEAERQALALMDHPNIAKVLDAGATDTGRSYFVMELVKGTSIISYCDEHRLTPRERLELFLPVCQAIQHAHQKGIIHRDIKPSNVLVAPYDGKPVVKVIDFGVAKATGQRLTEKTLFTQLGAVVGTLEYMSPEQAELNNQDIDTRSDIYSLGVLLYQLLTGTTPLSRERLRQAAFTEMLRIIREEEPPKPSMRLSSTEELPSISAQRHTEPAKLTKLVRGELDWIVMKALEKDRSRRYETANGFAMDVQRYLADEAVLACPPSAWYRFRKFARRNKVTLATATIVAVAVLVALGGLLSAVKVLADTNERVQEEQKRTQEALEREKKARAGEQRNHYFLCIGLAQRDLMLNNIGSADELLHECPAELRGWEWRFLKRQPYEAPVVVPLGKDLLYNLACSADGRYLATAGLGSSMRGEVKLRDAATGKELRTLTGHAVAFQPAGGQLATAADDGAENNVLLWDAATGKLLGTLRGHVKTITSLSYRPDGKRLASASLDCTVRVWDLATGADVLRFGDHKDPVMCVAYSPDGGRIASWGVDTHIRVWDAVTGEKQLQLEGHWHRVVSLLFSKDGRHLVSAGPDGRRIWDLQTGRPEQTFRGINSATLMATFSPDGRRLAFAGCDGTVQVWDWPSGQEVLALRGHKDVVTAVAFSSDGHRLYSASPDGTLRVWDGTPLAASGAEGRPLQGHQGPVIGLAFSPDGRSLATGGLDGTARLWDVGARKLVHTLPGQDVSTVAFYDGGRRLTTVSLDGTLVQWDPATGERRRTLSAHLGPIWNANFCAGFSADGERLASLSKDGAVRVWETDSGREVVSTREGAAMPMSAFLSPDGQRVAVAGIGSLRLLEVASKKSVADWSIGSLHGVHHLAFSADGRCLATASWDGTVRVWEIKSGKPLHTFHHSGHRQILGRSAPTTVACVAFHPNGRQLASGGSDNTAKVWDLDTDREVDTLRGSIGPVMALAYSPDGKLLAVASGHRYAGEVQLWETATFGKKR
jgi:WD40 repeat protein/serine/threonine protein kinase